MTVTQERLFLYLSWVSNCMNVFLRFMILIYLKYPTTLLTSFCNPKLWHPCQSKFLQLDYWWISASWNLVYSEYWIWEHSVIILSSSCLTGMFHFRSHFRHYLHHPYFYPRQHLWFSLGDRPWRSEQLYCNSSILNLLHYILLHDLAWKVNHICSISFYRRFFFWAIIFLDAAIWFWTQLV